MVRELVSRLLIFLDELSLSTSVVWHALMLVSMQR